MRESVDEIDKAQWLGLLEAGMSFGESRMAQVDNPNTFPFDKRKYWPLTIGVLALKESTYGKVVWRNILQEKNCHISKIQKVGRQSKARQRREFITPTRVKFVELSNQIQEVVNSSHLRR